MDADVLFDASTTKSEPLLFGSFSFHFGAVTSWFLMKSETWRAKTQRTLAKKKKKLSPCETTKRPEEVAQLRWRTFVCQCVDTMSTSFVLTLAVSFPAKQICWVAVSKRWKTFNVVSLWFCLETNQLSLDAWVIGSSRDSFSERHWSDVCASIRIGGSCLVGDTSRDMCVGHLIQCKTIDRINWFKIYLVKI